MSEQTELISADWVLPMDGEPIRHGGIVIVDDRIAAVGHRSELRADTATVYEDAIVLPGFVNAHAHLEYASFAGFGDGLEFGPWIDMHMNRKRRLGGDELLASARLGAACCLASGITTVADASFSGVSARACAELGLREDQPRLLSGLSDAALRGLYGNCSLFVFPSFLEGFGLPPLEAMACGAPVLAANTTSIPEVLGDAAVYFDPWRAPELEMQLAELLGDSGRLAQMKNASLARAAEFNPQRTGEAFLALCERL